MELKLRILLGFLIAGALLGGLLWSSFFLEPSIPPEWRVCNSDSDCVETRAGCCPCSMGGDQTAINKKYLEKWMEKLEKFCLLAPCPAEYKCEEGIVVCKDNRCEFLSAGPHGKPAVFLFTDKKNYRKGEEIKVTVISGIGIPIYYRDWSANQNECKGTSFRLGRKGERYTWNFSKIGRAECSNPVVKLEPYGEVTYSLDPNESEKLEEGTYQWEFTFGLEKDLKTTLKVFSKNPKVLKEVITPVNVSERDNIFVVHFFTWHPGSGEVVEWNFEIARNCEFKTNYSAIAFQVGDWKGYIYS